MVNFQTMKTLNHIAWRFSDEQYTDLNKFSNDVKQYQQDIYDDSTRWQPDVVVSEQPKVQIQYMAWINSMDDLLENETLIDEDKNIFEEEPDEDEHQVEIVALIKADNGLHLTTKEFLMKTHNQMANKELGDHVFFEGTDETPFVADGVPTYFIGCGS